MYACISLSLPLSLSLYIYIYTHTYMHTLCVCMQCRPAHSKAGVAGFALLGSPIRNGVSAATIEVVSRVQSLDQTCW